MKVSLPGSLCRGVKFAALKIYRIQDRICLAITGFWAVVMLVLLLLPGKAITLPVQHHEDKLYHFLMFAVLSSLTVLCVRNSRRILYLGNSSFVMVFCSGFGIVTEVLQKGIPGRVMSTVDGLANVAGAFAGLVLINLFLRCLSGAKRPLSLRDLVRIRPASE